MIKQVFRCKYLDVAAWMTQQFFLQAITITVDETQHNMTQQMGKQWHIQQNIQSL